MNQQINSSDYVRRLTFHPHLSHPGFGWLEPVMTMDDPLIAEEVAQALIVYCQQQIESASDHLLNITKADARDLATLLEQLSSNLFAIANAKQEHKETEHGL